MENRQFHGALNVLCVACASVHCAASSAAADARITKASLARIILIVGTSAFSELGYAATYRRSQSVSDFIFTLQLFYDSETRVSSTVNKSAASPYLLKCKI